MSQGPKEVDKRTNSGKTGKLKGHHVPILIKVTCSFRVFFFF